MHILCELFIDTVSLLCYWNMCMYDTFIITVFQEQAIPVIKVHLWLPEFFFYK